VSTPARTDFAQYLPAPDAAYLADRYSSGEVAVDGGMLCVLLPEWELPFGFTAAAVDLLLRLPANFPDTQPDMWWMSPTVALVSGQPIAAADLIETHLGRTWQRWSRHLPAGLWNTGTDGIQTYLAQIRTVLQRTVLGTQ
jgi:hypothetical protein